MERYEEVDGKDIFSRENRIALIKVVEKEMNSRYLLLDPEVTGMDVARVAAARKIVRYV